MATEPSIESLALKVQICSSSSGSFVSATPSCKALPRKTGQFAWVTAVPIPMTIRANIAVRRISDLPIWGWLVNTFILHSDADEGREIRRALATDRKESDRP